MFCNFFPENRAAYEVMRKKKKYGRTGQDADGNLGRRMSLACWVTEDVNEHSEYVIHSAFFFSRRQWFRQRVALFRHSAFTVLPEI